MDANQGMNVSSALALSQRAKQYDIHWFEEPIEHTGYAGYEWTQRDNRRRSPYAVLICAKSCASCPRSSMPSRLRIGVVIIVVINAITTSIVNRVGEKT